jgi:ketosteroid isomerase-like protein
MPTTSPELRELDQRWLEAETKADVAALDELATPDFTLVGPAGFVLDKVQWLARYRIGDLVTRSLSFEDPTTRIYGDTAITIGRLVQDAEYRTNPASGEFRATQIAVRDGSQWRLGGLHLSPIMNRPPVAGSAAPPAR